MAGCAVILAGLVHCRNSILVEDIPNERSLHTGTARRGGGIAIIMTVAVIAGWLWVPEPGKWTWQLIIGASLLGYAVIGLLDDRNLLSISQRLVAQTIFAGSLFVTAIQIGWIQPADYFPIFKQTLFLPLWLLLPALGLWLLWMVNLFNFMDGIDGLAAAQAVVAAFTLGFWFYANGETFLGLVNFSLAGSVLAFALFNWSPARVFLGDVGSLSLGAWFGWMSILGAISGKLPFEAFLLLYGLFVFDASYTLVVRIIRGEDWWRGHRNHLYQRLVRAGWSHKKVSAVSLVGCITLATLASLNVSGAGHPVLWISIGFLGLAVAAGQVRRIEAKIKR